MMNLILSIVLLLAALFALLFVGLKKADKRSVVKHEASKHDDEIRRLIRQFDADKAALAQVSDAEKSTRLAELEVRLYNELKPFNRENKQRSGQTPTWAYALVIVSILAALAGWYFHGGHFILQWQKLDKSMDHALTRSQYLDELPQQMPPEIMSTYCLALQNRIDRADFNQLDTLAQCVASYGNYPVAKQIYQYIYRKDPSNHDNIINYAQMSLFSQQGQPLTPELEQALANIWREESDNYMAGVLLASSYTQSGAAQKAAAIWQQLVDTMPQDHPLFDLVATTHQRISTSASMPMTAMPEVADQRMQTDASSQPLEFIINIAIDAKIIDSLSPSSRLYVLASPQDSPMPIAVKKLELKPNQTITLSDQDSMQGQSLQEFQTLNISAILSLDGQANGNNAHKLTKQVELESLDSASIDLSFEFSSDESP